jgi:hypothetical protein
LTRGSIALREKLLAKAMDGRVKPGHDGLRAYGGKAHSLQIEFLLDYEMRS